MSIFDELNDLFDQVGRFFQRDPERYPPEDRGQEFRRPEGVGHGIERLERDPAAPKWNYGEDATPGDVPSDVPSFQVGGLQVVRDADMIPEGAESRGHEFSDWDGVLAYLDSGPGRSGLKNGLFIIREIWYESSDEPYYEIFVSYEDSAIPA